MSTPVSVTAATGGHLSRLWAFARSPQARPARLGFLGAVLIAASAPTAHALRLADQAGITVAAFVRDGRFDLYAHPFRIAPEASDVA